MPVPNVHHAETRLEATASGEPVVMLHCSASSAKQWRPLAERLGGRFHPISVDLWGHGAGEAWCGEGPLSLMREATAIESAVADKSQRFHLIGHSYGGGVALSFALNHPERLASLTLAEPSCFHILMDADDEAHLLDEIRAVAEAVNQGVICGDYRGAMEIFIDYWGGAGTWANLREDQRDQHARLAVYVAHHFWSLIETETPLSAYAAIDAPTLILSGTRSPAPSRAITRHLTETLTRAKHRTIRGAGHMAPITHSDAVNPIILEHLARNDTSPRPHPQASADRAA